MPDPDLTQEIETIATGPKRAQGDFGSYENQSIDDLIKADKYLASKRAKRGFRITKISPGNAIGS